MFQIFNPGDKAPDGIKQECARELDLIVRLLDWQGIAYKMIDAAPEPVKRVEWRPHIYKEGKILAYGFFGLSTFLTKTGLIRC